MKNKPRHPKRSYNKLVRDMVDSDYKENIPVDTDGKEIEGLKLSEKDKQFLYDFEDGYYGNNHRKIEMFTKHPEYESRIKKELDDSNNARMRDLLAMNRYDKKIISDLTNIANPSYSNNELTDILREQGFENTINDLIENTLIDLDGLTIKTNHDINEGKKILANMSIDIVRVIKMEQSARRKEK